MSRESEYYDKLYSENAVTFGKGMPEGIVTEIVAQRTSGSVLELGAGEGRNSLFLAQQGFDVTAQDQAKVGIDKIRKQAAERGLNIHAEVGDARTALADGNFDIIVSTFMLHHLSRQEALALIQRIQDCTNVEGLNAIAAFTNDGDFYNEKPDTSKFYPHKNELRELYEGWEIVNYTELRSTAQKKKSDGSPMFNTAARLLAKKIK